MIHFIAFLFAAHLQTVHAQEAQAPTDPKVLQVEDMEKLAETAAHLLAGCPDVKAQPAVFIKSFANKTDEHINKKKFTDVLREQLKSAGHINVVPQKGRHLGLALELTVTRNQTGNLYRGTYRLSVNVFLNGEPNCAISSKFEKTGQTEEPKKTE